MREPDLSGPDLVKICCNENSFHHSIFLILDGFFLAGPLSFWRTGHHVLSVGRLETSIPLRMLPVHVSSYRRVLLHFSQGHSCTEH